MDEVREFTEMEETGDEEHAHHREKIHRGHGDVILARPNVDAAVVVVLLVGRCCRRYIGPRSSRVFASVQPKRLCTNTTVPPEETTRQFCY